MEPDYKHTQYGVLMFVVFMIVGILITVVAVAIIAEGEYLQPVIMILVTLVFVAMFYSSTVEVSAGRVRFWFGIGVVRKTIPLNEIQSTKQLSTRGTTSGGSSPYRADGCMPLHRDLQWRSR